MASPPKGLLPQLVDVLCALTESQQLLTGRIQTAHLELLGVHPPSGGEPCGELSLNYGSAAAFQHAASSAIEARDICDEASPSDSCELSIQHPDVHPDFNSNQGIAGSCVSLDDFEVGPLPDLRTATATSVHDHHAPENAPSKQNADLQGPGRVEASIKSAKSYNYFDELDLQLAALGDVATQNDETSSGQI